MKKTVTISLNSFIFNIDEDAYQVLSLYLDKLTQHFSKTEEGNEIIKDIEARIAELFGEKLSPNKQVINIDDVNEIISVLGYVDDIIDSDETSKSSNEEKKFKKKLYRDPDSRVIGGVCSGLAHYTGLSIILWRIIFLLFLIIPGNVGIVAYIILWIAVPSAKTTAQKLKMKGEKVNLENIEKTVKEEYEDIKENLRNLDSKRFSDVIQRVGHAMLSAFTIIFKALTPFIGAIFIFVGIICLIFLLIGFLSVGTDNIFYSEGFFSFIWLPSLLVFVTNYHIAWMLSISILIIFLIPLIGLMYTGIILLFKLKGNRYLNGSLVVIWILSIITSVFLIINISTGYKSVAFNSVSENIPVSSEFIYNFSLLDDDPSFDKTYMFGKHENKKNTHKIKNINELHVFIESRFFQIEKNKIKIRPSIEFSPANSENPEIEFRYYARGRTKYDARENIEFISYNYKITDSVVNFSPFYHINSQRWNAQNLRIIVKIPYGSKIFIDKSLANLLDDEDITGKYYKGELAGKKWISTREGLLIAND